MQSRPARGQHGAVALAAGAGGEAGPRLRRGHLRWPAWCCSSFHSGRSGLLVASPSSTAASCSPASPSPPATSRADPEPRPARRDHESVRTAAVRTVHDRAGLTGGVDVEQAAGDHVGVERALVARAGPRRDSAGRAGAGAPAAPAASASAVGGTVQPASPTRYGMPPSAVPSTGRPCGQRLDDHRRQHVVPGRRRPRPRRAARSAAAYPGAVQRAQVLDVGALGGGRLDQRRAASPSPAMRSVPERAVRVPAPGVEQQAERPSPRTSRPRNRNPSPSGGGGPGSGIAFGLTAIRSAGTPYVAQVVGDRVGQRDEPVDRAPGAAGARPASSP